MGSGDRTVAGRSAIRPGAGPARGGEDRPGGADAADSAVFSDVGIISPRPDAHAQMSTPYDNPLSLFGDSFPPIANVPEGFVIRYDFDASRSTVI